MSKKTILAIEKFAPRIGLALGAFTVLSLIVFKA